MRGQTNAGNRHCRDRGYRPRNSHAWLNGTCVTAACNRERVTAARDVTVSAPWRQAMRRSLQHQHGIRLPRVLGSKPLARYLSAEAARHERLASVVRADIHPDGSAALSAHRTPAHDQTTGDAPSLGDMRLPRRPGVPMRAFPGRCRVTAARLGTVRIEVPIPHASQRQRRQIPIG
jgi:hypothetical protein